MAGRKQPLKTFPREGFATVNEACAFLKLGRNSVYNLMNGKKLMSRKVGRSRRIPWPALHKFAESGAV